MRTPKAWILLASTLLLVVSGCSILCPDCDDCSEGGPDPPHTEVADYFPLAVGMRWTYEFYRPDGEPYHDEDGQVATRTFGVLWSGEEMGRVCYLLQTLGGASTSPDPGLPAYVDSIAPRGIGGVTDSIKVWFGSDVTSVADVSVVSDPAMELGAPMFSPDRRRVAFAPQHEWEPYTDYSLTITVDLTWQGGPVTEDFGHDFRTSDSVFDHVTVEQVCSVAGDTLYRFHPRVSDFDFSDRDSCEVLLLAPFDVGAAWLGSTTGGEGTYYIARIVSVGHLDVLGVGYDDVIEVTHTPEGSRAVSSLGCDEETNPKRRYWFAPSVGIVQLDNGSVVAQLVAYEP